jgi:hypothetical protein
VAVTDDELGEMFVRTTGRKPASGEELAAFCAIEQTKINPRLAEVGRNVVKHAEALGGVHLAYARARFAYYWGEYRLELTETQAAEALGITIGEGGKLFRDTFGPAMAECAVSPAWTQEQPRGSTLNELRYES